MMIRPLSPAEGQLRLPFKFLMRQLRLRVRGLVTFTLRESDVFYTSVVVGYDCVSRRDLPVAGTGR
jgi:hypothetical protein